MQKQAQRKLKKNKGVVAYLREIQDLGRIVRPFSKSGEAARKAGYTQDVVRMLGGDHVSEAEAKSYLGDYWYQQVFPTPFETLTEAGKQALRDLDNTG